MLAMPLYSLQVFSRAIPSGNYDTLIMLTVIVVIALTLSAGLEMVRSRLLARAGNALEVKWRRRLTAEALDSAGRGRPDSAPLADLMEVKGALSRPSLPALMDLPWAPLYVLGIYVIHPMLAAILVVSMLLMALMGWIAHVAVKSFAEDGKQPSSRAQKLFDALLTKSDTVRGLRMGGSAMDSVSRDFLTSSALQGLAHERSAAIGAATKWLRMVLQIAVTATGAWLVIEQHLSFGGMIATSMLVGRGLAPIEQTAGAWGALIRSYQATSRLLPLLKRLSREPERPAVPVENERLVVENLLFVSPRDQKPVLRSVSLTVEPGETICVAGPNRAGKSILARLLAGVAIPSAGTVRLGGLSVATLSPETPEQGIGYLPQHVDLLPGSIADNIARFATASREQVEAAAKAVGIHEWIETLPAGYDTDVADPLFPMTGASARMIGLARAGFGQPPLLVLDEPAAGLDELGMKSVREFIAAAKKRGATTIVCTHSPAFVDLSDRTYVLKNGMAMELPRQDQQAQQGVNFARLRNLGPAPVGAAMGAAG
ncbi:PrtD family type I secretion system ABC transporter [Azospirillum agricola]|uniref:type I secretion system permease/ATPase n=1 Tax=Azospirillum agricola TaxID=1720247 RepID=UPI001AE7E8B4|nr:ATP-binding cassette domain-containing protein [Azospirillum agricola]MBP2229352.1 PrtD family type I secretion system ABC transporter [Azospirillum agricola]